jgi:hypothetical protein
VQQDEVGRHQPRRRQTCNNNHLLPGAHRRVVQHAGFNVGQHGLHRFGLGNQVGGNAPQQGQALIGLRVGCEGQNGHMRARLGHDARVAASQCKYSDGGHVAVVGQFARRTGQGDRVVRSRFGGAMPASPLFAVVFGLADNGGHHAHGLDGVLAAGRLARQHHRVGAVVNGVGHVGGFGTRRQRVGHHRLEHLRGRNDNLALAVCRGDDTLLCGGHFLRRELDAQVAAGHHDAIGHLDNGVQVVERGRLFQLGNNGQLGGPGVNFHQCTLHGSHVFGPAHEAYGHHVHLLCHAEGKVFAVLLGEAGDVDHDAGQIDALVFAQQSTVHHASVNIGAVDAFHRQNETPIVKQQAVAAVDVAWQAFVGRRYLTDRSVNVAGGNGERGLLFEQHGVAAGKCAGADLRALQVLKD